MKRLLSVAVLAGAGYLAWRYYQEQARPPQRRAPKPPTDELLTRRVLVSLRHAAVMPDAFQVRVLDGTVMLSGAVGAADRDRLLRAVLAVPGIRGVRNELEARSTPSGDRGLTPI
jgi:hypothetical protein